MKGRIEGRRERDVETDRQTTETKTNVRTGRWEMGDEREEAFKVRFRSATRLQITKIAPAVRNFFTEFRYAAFLG